MRIAGKQIRAAIWGRPYDVYDSMEMVRHDKTFACSNGREFV